MAGEERLKIQMDAPIGEIIEATVDNAEASTETDVLDTAHIAEIAEREIVLRHARQDTGRDHEIVVLGERGVIVLVVAAFLIAILLIAAFLLCTLLESRRIDGVETALLLRLLGSREALRDAGADKVPLVGVVVGISVGEIHRLIVEASHLEEIRLVDVLASGLRDVPSEIVGPALVGLADAVGDIGGGVFDLDADGDHEKARRIAPELQHIALVLPIAWREIVEIDTHDAVVGALQHIMLQSGIGCGAIGIEIHGTGFGDRDITFLHIL